MAPTQADVSANRLAGAEMQLSPNLRWLKEQLDAGLLGGRLLQIDAYGKMDRRAG